MKLIAAFILAGCCKSIDTISNDISFAGITLYPDRTYDLVYAEHDVGGRTLNFGTFFNKGDTVMLQLDKETYLKKMIEPVSCDCEKNGVLLKLKEYYSEYEPGGLIEFYWLDLKVKGMQNNKDTISILESKSISRKENPYLIFLDSNSLEEVTHIWVEIYNSATTKPIQLPSVYKCLQINIPLIDVIGSQVWDRRIVWGMDEFVIKKCPNKYRVKSIKRNSVYKIKKSK